MRLNSRLGRPGTKQLLASSCSFRSSTQMATLSVRKPSWASPAAVDSSDAPTEPAMTEPYQWVGRGARSTHAE
jgi:hypothetical protein